MMEGTFDAARAHLQIVLGIDLERHLDIRHPEQFKTYALLGTLIVVYRYAEALGHHMVIFDMTTGGPHVSHKHGMDLDFDYEPGTFNPVNQANVISDMLRVGRAMNDRLHAFRLGFYFDFFNNKAAIDTVRTFDDFQRIYGRSPAEFRSLRGHRLSSMHLGVRYEFESADYKGEHKTRRGFWGRDQGETGDTSFSHVWSRRIRDWPIGLIGERASLVAAAALRDLDALDRNPPTLVVLGAMGAGPLR